jgi:hypothetical protein
MFGSNGTGTDIVKIINDYVNTFNREVFIVIRQAGRNNTVIPKEERDAMTIILNQSNRILKQILPKNKRVNEIAQNNTDIVTQLKALDSNPKVISILTVLVQTQVDRHHRVFTEIINLMADYSNTFNADVMIPIRASIRNTNNILKELSTEIPTAVTVLKNGNRNLEDTFAGSERMRDIIDNNKDLLKELDTLQKSMSTIDKTLRNIHDLTEVQVKRNTNFLTSTQELKKTV